MNFLHKTFFVLAILLFSIVPVAHAIEYGGFSIIVLPDTQKYSENFPGVFTSQTEWIVENVEELNIVFVSHEGDIVQSWSKEEEWKNASESMSVLDGVVPYGVLPGNHDLGGGNGLDFFNKYFPATKFSSQPWFGGSFPEGKNNNNYQLFSGAGQDFVILHIGMCPDGDAIAWANSVLSKNSKRAAIITTHGFLGRNASRKIHSCGSRGGNMEYMWDELIYPNPNVFLVLSGHVHTEARRTDPNIAGVAVHQLLADYQTNDSKRHGGDGFLRILSFFPSREQIEVKTFSPYLNEFKEGPDSEFVLSFKTTNFEPKPKPLSRSEFLTQLQKESELESEPEPEFEPVIVFSEIPDLLIIIGAGVISLLAVIVLRNVPAEN